MSGWSNTRCSEYLQQCADALAEMGLLCASLTNDDPETGHSLVDQNFDE